MPQSRFVWPQPRTEVEEIDEINRVFHVFDLPTTQRIQPQRRERDNHTYSLHTKIINIQVESVEGRGILHQTHGSGIFKAKQLFVTHALCKRRTSLEIFVYRFSTPDRNRYREDRGEGCQRPQSRIQEAKLQGNGYGE